jgi:xanthine dehydrogenase molybdenum-binding subunit
LTVQIRRYPFGTSAYASRQTYVGVLQFTYRHAVEKQGAEICGVYDRKSRRYARSCQRIVIEKESKEEVILLEKLATSALYSSISGAVQRGRHTQIKSNAYSFGCGFAEVEVDIPMCKVKLRHDQRT